MSEDARGLEGVVVAPTAISKVDGEKGALVYHGIDIHDLAQHSSFEETVFLLWTTSYMLGIPMELYTPIFAMSRVAGWTAHIMEQQRDNRLIRPRSEYVGQRDVPYVPIEKR